MPNVLSEADIMGNGLGTTECLRGVSLGSAIFSCVVRYNDWRPLMKLVNDRDALLESVSLADVALLFVHTSGSEHSQRLMQEIHLGSKSTAEAQNFKVEVLDLTTHHPHSFSTTSTPALPSHSMRDHCYGGAG